MPSFAGKPASFFAATGNVPVEGAWYHGQRYLGGRLLAPGEHQPGQRVSTEVIAQTDPRNVAFIESRIAAQDLTTSPPISLPSQTSATSGIVNGLQATVDTARTNLESTLGVEKEIIDERMKILREKETAAVEEIGTLTQPFREELETTERERLHITENFEANQKLVNELDTLLTQGNELIAQQKDVTGLAAIRNPRVQKTMEDVAARTGVIEAVINARNGQIGIAEGLIDRTVDAITKDRSDRIDYYETILNLNNRDIVSLDKDAKNVAEEQLNLLKTDLKRAEATQDFVKQLMIDPATAQLMGEAGVTLNDSIESINAKMANAQYAREVVNLSNEMVAEGAEKIVDTTGIPQSEVRVMTDTRGQKHIFRVREKAKVGTASERSVGSATTQISSQNMNFPDVVVSFANQLSLAQIYDAYAKSTMGQRFGRPAENPNEIALLYQWARGDITEAEYRAAIGG